MEGGVRHELSESCEILVVLLRELHTLKCKRIVFRNECVDLGYKVGDK